MNMKMFFLFNFILSSFLSPLIGSSSSLSTTASTRSILTEQNSQFFANKKNKTVFQGKENFLDEINVDGSHMPPKFGKKISKKPNQQLTLFDMGFTRKTNKQAKYLASYVEPLKTKINSFLQTIKEYEEKNNRLTRKREKIEELAIAILSYSKNTPSLQEALKLSDSGTSHSSWFFTFENIIKTLINCHPKFLHKFISENQSSCELEIPKNKFSQIIINLASHNRRPFDEIILPNNILKTDKQYTLLDMKGIKIIKPATPFYSIGYVQSLNKIIDALTTITNQLNENHTLLEEKNKNLKMVFKAALSQCTNQSSFKKIIKKIINNVHLYIFTHDKFKEKWLPSFQDMSKILSQNPPEFEIKAQNNLKVFQQMKQFCRKTCPSYGIIFENIFHENHYQRNFEELFPEILTKLPNIQDFVNYFDGAFNKDQVSYANHRMILQKNIEALKNFIKNNQNDDFISKKEFQETLSGFIKGIEIIALKDDSIRKLLIKPLIALSIL